MSLCSATRADGSPCRAHAIADEDYCFTHHPDRGEERALARQAGGKARAAARLPSDLDVPMLGSARDVARLLSATIGHVLRGELDPRVANSAGYLAGLVLKAIEQGALEDRLATLETIIQSERTRVDYAFDDNPEPPLLAESIEP